MEVSNMSGILVVAKIGTKHEYFSLLKLGLIVNISMPETWITVRVSLQFITAVDHFSEIKGFEIIIIRIQSKAFAALLLIRPKKLISF